MSELKICPFCGGDDLNVFRVDEESKCGYDCVECNGCGVEVFGDVDEWNKRATDATMDKLMNLARLASLLPHDNDHNSVVVKTMAKELLEEIGG